MSAATDSKWREFAGCYGAEGSFGEEKKDCLRFRSHAVRFFIPVLALLNWTKGTIRTAAPRVQDSAKKSATNSFVAGAKMKIKRAIATTAILGGLASLAYAQRPSATCPVHGVSGHPTGAPIDAKGQCESEHSMDGGNSIHYFRASCYY